MGDWKPLLEAAQAECPTALWSKGIELARIGAVAGETRDRDAWSFRVRVPGRPIAPTVNLYPEDREWDCDCGSRFDACEHVAASVAAVVQSSDGPEALFAAAVRNGGVRYELSRRAEGIVLERFLCDEAGPPRQLQRPLLDLIARGDAELTIAPTHGDLAIDRLVGRAAPSPLSFDKATALLRALVAVEDVRLEGEPVQASGEPLYPRARVVDASGDAVELIIEPDPEISEVVAPGVLRRGDTLHPFGAEERFGRSWERLPFRRVFAPAAIAELVGTVLPELDRHIPVLVETDRLPEREGPAAPWIRFDIDYVDGGIDVLALLVYGDPPRARVDNGRLVHLQGAVPTRDEPRERSLLLRLRDQLNLALGRRVHFVAADAARFLTAMQSFADGRKTTRPLDARAVSLAARLHRREGSDGLELDLVFEAADDERAGRAGEPATATAAAVYAAWRDGIGLVPLSDGRFASVPAKWLADHGQLVADLLSAREQNDGRTPRAAWPLVGELCQALDEPEPFELSRVRALLESVTASSDAARSGGEAASPPAPSAVPAVPEVRAHLRAYQAAGVAWLASLRDAGLGAVLADDMGLGKTLQALCMVHGRTLVVCPRSVIHNWTKEVARFRPDLTVGLYHGPQRELTACDLTLTTYATLRNDADALAAIAWDVVVLDEAQAIKNPESQTAQVAYRLQAAFRLSLSGTPIENRLDELWSQMHFTNRGLLGGRRDFTRRYEAPIQAGDATAAERLRRRIRPFLLRRLKKDVAAELPPRTEAVLYCELDEQERAIYDAVHMASRHDVVRRLSEGSGVLGALEALLRLRQAACHAGLLPGRAARSSSKVEALCDALEDAVADGHKALVFSQWTGLLDLVEPHLSTREIQFTRLDGSTRDRGAVVDSFQEPAGPPVLLLSLTAGGTGLNLTAADHVFLLDPWWNPAVEDQAADRAHRIGQDRPVMVYRLVAKDTVEERVLDLQARKRRVADVALSAGRPGDVAAAAITRDDILELLE